MLKAHHLLITKTLVNTEQSVTSLSDKGLLQKQNEALHLPEIEKS